MNIFFTDYDPKIAAQNLDDKRVVRMIYETADLLAGAIKAHSCKVIKFQKLRREVAAPAKQHASHPATAWVGKCRENFEWTLVHLKALHEEYQFRYQTDKRHKSYVAVYPIAKKVTEFFDLENMPMNFGNGWFNDDKFRFTDTALGPHVDLKTRYRLSMIHKYFYLDKQEAKWSTNNIPLWLFNPLYHRFLTVHFGAPTNSPAQLEMQGEMHYVQLARKVGGPLMSYTRISEKIAQRFNLVWVTHSDELISSCIFDENEEYRYFLSRQWSSNPPLVVLMLNPSTADQFKNDRTVAKIEKLARREKKGGYIILNMFAWRATEPQDMLKAGDPVGEYNLPIIKATLKAVINRWRVKPEVLLGYGINAEKVQQKQYVTNVVNTCLDYGNVVVLDITADGHPKHPLYIADDETLKSYLPW